jgi:hypothetical protein
MIRLTPREASHQSKKGPVMRESLFVKAMLGYLLEDIESNPHKLQPVPAEMKHELDAFTFGMSFDPDDPIEGAVDI